MIRIAYIGVSHWHLKFYLEPILKMDSVEIVGVADPSQEAADKVALRVGSKAFTDYQQMCETVKPDFVFVLGAHVEMADSVRYLLETGVPFAVEKPSGTSAEELAGLARLAESKGAFGAVSFPWRQSPLAQLLLERAERDELRYVMFRRLLGPPTRYLDWGSEWMLDRQLAAGGCTLNLSVHWLDLFAHIMGGKDVSVASAFLSSDAYGLSIEDYSLVTLQSGRSACVVETGYIFPGGKFDMHFSAKSDSDYLVFDGSGSGQLYPSYGEAQTLEVPANPDYDSYVRDILARWQAGDQPDAGLDDMRRVMEMVDASYERSGWVGGTRTADDLRKAHESAQR